MQDQYEERIVEQLRHYLAGGDSNMWRPIMSLIVVGGNLAPPNFVIGPIQYRMTRVATLTIKEGLREDVIHDQRRKQF